MKKLKDVKENILCSPLLKMKQKHDTSEFFLTLIWEFTGYPGPMKSSDTLNYIFNNQHIETKEPIL